MAKNEFKPFATGEGANVTPQADWENLPARQSGFQSGKASGAQVNKALRQASFVASALAQFVADKSGQDIPDDGDVESFVSRLTSGFAKQYLTRSNPFADINSDGTEQQARNNLGFDALGIGTGTVTPLLSLDWQAFNFISGANYLVAFSGMTNTPPGMTFTSSTQVWVRVVGSAGSFISVEVIPATTVDSNYKIYEIHFNKATGNRTFSVRQVLTELSYAFGSLINIQTFTSSGTYTPTAGTKFVIVEVQGGGGSGGVPATGASSVATSGAGGAGAYAKSRITSGFSGVSVTVGSGGAAGTSGGGDGGTGGASSFGTLIVCPGGNGGLSTGSVAVSFPTSRGGSAETTAPTGGNIVSSKGKGGLGQP